LWDREQPGSTRVAAWCALRDTGFDKPAQRIAFKDYTEHPASNLLNDGDNVDRFADLYALMIGASPDSPPPMIDITPSPSSTLPARRYVDIETQRQQLRRMTDELRQMHEEERAEKDCAGSENVEPEERETSRPRTEPPRQRLMRRPRR